MRRRSKLEYSVWNTVERLRTVFFARCPWACWLFEAPRVIMQLGLFGQILPIGSATATIRSRILSSSSRGTTVDEPVNSPLKLNKSIVRSWNAAFVLALVTLHLLLVGRAEAQGHFFHGGTTYRYRSVTRSGPGVNLLPGSMMMSSVSSAPIMGQPLALDAGNRSPFAQFEPKHAVAWPSNTIICIAARLQGCRFRSHHRPVINWSTARIQGPLCRLCHNR